MRILILILFPILLFGSTYYLDNFAPDGGNGTINSPFNSLSQALEVLDPGDTLVIRGSNNTYGQIYFENLDLPKSGKDTQRITLKSFQDEVVVISILKEFNIDEQFWTFDGLIFEDSKSGFSDLQFSGKNNNFYNCVFRSSNVNIFDFDELQDNQFKFCRIEN